MNVGEKITIRSAIDKEKVTPVHDLIGTVNTVNILLDNNSCANAGTLRFDGFAGRYDIYDWQFHGHYHFTKCAVDEKNQEFKIKDLPGIKRYTKKQSEVNYNVR